MGSKASTTNVAADMSPPNYRAAVQRLRTIKPKKEKIAGVNGEIADIYAKVEGHKVNKKAARIFLVLDQLDAADRLDVMRSFNGLCDAAGWETEGEDLVDQAQGTVVPFRAPGGSGDASADVDDELDRLEAEAASDALASARAHLNGAGTAEEQPESSDAGDDGD